jgi:hypothetical protein
MGLWRFLDYRTDDEVPRNLIQDWYGQQDLDVQAEFDATVTTLAATEDWRKAKAFKLLGREHSGLAEIRFTVRTKRRGKETKRRFRPVGIWREEAWEFVFLVGCEKLMNGVLVPANAFDLALTHRTKLECGEGDTCEHY